MKYLGHFGVKYVKRHDLKKKNWGENLEITYMSKYNVLICIFGIMAVAIYLIASEDFTPCKC